MYKRQLNCRSTNHKIPVIHDLITNRNLDVLFLSETWFTSDTPQSILLDVAPAGYAAVHVVRPTGPGKPKRGGELAAVFRESVAVRVHHFASTLAPRTFELQLLREEGSKADSSVIPPFNHFFAAQARTRHMARIPYTSPNPKS